MSYIVRNCPAITEYKFPDKVHKDCCQCTYGYCKDIDCVIKQVIELCKKEAVINYPKREKEFITVNGYQAILNMFDIEEVRE